jgi:hypothetical protein
VELWNQLFGVMTSVIEADGADVVGTTATE